MNEVLNALGLPNSYFDDAVKRSITHLCEIMNTRCKIEDFNHAVVDMPDPEGQESIRDDQERTSTDTGGPSQETIKERVRTLLSDQYQ